ncbi:MAG: hypothetical protein QY326_09210 [Bdellovibrionota bacterium]|nr:MAG: hypothetical protein QY326_09210 [Bdellovibrionota bacterium]
MITALVVVMVVALFFIPELVDFQFGAGSESASSRSARQVDKAPTVDLPAVPQKESPLAQVSALLDSGYIDRLVQERSGVPSAAALSGTTAEAILGGRAVTWPDIREGAVRNALYKARDEAAALASSISVQHVNSRFGLVSLVSGIDALLTNTQVQLQPEQALQYLEWLSQSVTNAMIREGVERADFLAWKKIDLGPLLENSRAQREKLEYTLAFNPKIEIERVSIMQPGDKWRRYSPDSNVNVYVTIRLRNRDVKRLAVYGNGTFMREVLVPAADPEGISRVFLSELDGKKILTFKAWDINGAIYEKSYFFYPKLRHFSWSPATFFFELPFKQGDLNADRFFRYHSDPAKRERKEYSVF